MAKEIENFQVAIVDNDIVILDSAGTNLISARNHLEKYRAKVISFSKIMRFFTVSFAVVWFAGFFNLYSQFQILYGVLGGIFGALFLFSFLENDEKKNMIERLQKRINLAHVSLEDEILSAKQRLITQQQMLHSSSQLNQMFKNEEKEINF